MPGRLRLALDQNFPLPAIDALHDLLPPHLELVSLHRLDPRLSTLGDRELVLWLAEQGWDGLVTNNWRMLNIAEEVAAVEATHSVLVVVRGLGDHPLRAAGALLLDILDLHRRMRPRQSNVFDLAYRPRQSRTGWSYLEALAERRGVATSELWSAVRPSRDELARNPLAP